jgi:hypothetical protein
MGKGVAEQHVRFDLTDGQFSTVEVMIQTAACRR